MRWLLVVPKIQMALLYPRGYLATMVIFVVPRLCSSVGPLIFFSPLRACIALLGAMRTSPQEGGFQVSSNLIPLILVPEVCDVFRNRVLPSGSGRRLRSMGIAYIVLGESSNCTTNKLKGAFPWE